MTISLILLWIMSMTIAMALATTPLMLGIWVLIMAFMVASIVCLPLTSWLSFIIFLIYIGGLLVMFAYFIAIDPNKKLNFMAPIILPMIIMASIYALASKMSLSPTLMFSSTNAPAFASLYMMNNIPILILLTLILLLAMVVVVNIANPTEGPLRPFK
uniref:NADH dehydrogenase subunit 6 n=1 Tax=Asychis amphiglyptus TaxID=1931186 RepID=UPI0022DCDC78|nr:NADH dehydrogenase subunit 6 [Asychis amphiglyptus]UZZ45806.1 NADH dehydrogenase subunit 6 [Asychis amphiglyptus]